ncbi:S-adenosyl-L-methionine-dependent methyltransferase [Phytophthora cactorum]|nr:S-adenosyl-L-methionine-dependent methyltransferase [Phytophthora cactorum]
MAEMQRNERKPISRVRPGSQTISSSPNRTQFSQMKVQQYRYIQVRQELRQGPVPPIQSPAGTSSVLSSTNEEQAVASIATIGVTALLREIGDVDTSDVFFDIGAGLGNVVAQFVLATKVSNVIGLEVRADVYIVGMEMIAKSGHGQHIQEKTEFYCNAVTGLCFSRMLLYKQATILFWNNILFEPVIMD